MLKLIYPGLLLVLGLTSFICNLPDPSEYDIAHPDKKFELHESLNEISGITDINNNRIACIHDEDGIIFILDLSSGEIVSQFRFAGEGDYEGITRVDQTFYVLQS